MALEHEDLHARLKRARHAEGHTGIAAQQRLRRPIASATGVKPEVWSVPENHYHRLFKTVRPADR